MKVRPAFLPVHRWVGLTLGILVLISAATGAGMAFRAQLDPLIYPELFKASPCAAALPLDTLVRHARAAHPKTKFAYIRIPAAGDEPVAIRFANKDTLYVDRCTGVVTGSQNRYAGFFGTLEYIHRGQWVQGGGLVMGAGAIVMLIVLGAGGVFLWWPRNARRLRQHFVIDRRWKGPAFTLGLHRTLGSWAALFLMVSAITALPNAFDSVKARLMSVGAPAGEAALVSLPPSGKRARTLPLQTVWRIVTRLAPAPREVLVPLTRRERSDPLEIFIIEATAPHANARTYLDLDAYSGNVLKFTPYRESSIGAKLYYWGLSLHTGKIGGLPGQIALFFGAASALVLGYTGFQSYFGRLARRRNARRAAVAGSRERRPFRSGAVDEGASIISVTKEG